MAFELSKYFLSECRPASKFVDLCNKLILEYKAKQLRLMEEDPYAYATNFQRSVLDLTFHHPKALQYPPSLSYQNAVLKTLLKMFEDQNMEIMEDVYKTLSDLILKASSEEAYSYRTYLLDKSGKCVTLQESKSLVINGTTGLQTWEAAKRLSEWVCEEETFIKNKAILELGCGVGLTGLVACCVCQPHQYVFTDIHPTVLHVLQKNINLNKENINCDTEISVQELDWESKLDTIGNYNLDIILAADVVFDPALFPGLSNVLCELLNRNPGSVAVIACTVRNVESLNTFLNMLGTSQLKVTEIESSCSKRFFYGDTHVKIYKVST